VLALVVLSVSLSGKAGDLNPPPGPISPTMHSLDEIYFAIERGTQGCPPCLWESRLIDDSAGVHEVQIASGAGVVHAVMIKGQDDVALSDGPIENGGDILAKYLPIDTPITLDVSYDDGLYLSGSCFANAMWGGTIAGTITTTVCPSGRLRALVFFRSDP